MNNKYDYLIMGSGLFGATFAYFARQSCNRQTSAFGWKCIL